MSNELYLIPFFIYIFSYALILPRKKKLHKFFTILIYAGFILQSLIFFVFLSTKGFNASVHIGWFVFFNAWLLMTVIVLFGLFYRAEYILLYVTPLVAVNLLIGFFVPHIKIEPAMFSVDKTILLTHIILILIGDSFFALAFMVSLIYIFQERKIKIKKSLKLFDKKDNSLDEVFHSGSGYNLELLDNINYQCLKIGFPFITIGIALGIYLSSSLFNAVIVAKPIEIISLIIWLIYAVLLHERIAKGVRGKRAAVFNVIGFLFILFSLSFSFYLFPTLHGF
ncbi:MAG TPA: hypothetical protein ENI54_00785 [bacterium]|nr:hypothetical protein [bacterium]